MKIIGIVGFIGCGKDTVEEYIAEKYGYESINMGDLLREMAAKEGLTMSREGLRNLRIRKGNTFLAEEVVRRIKDSGWKKVIIVGIRRSEDYEIPREAFGGNIRLILVDVTEENRFERIKKRGREGDPQNIEEFREQDQRDNEIFDFDKTFSYADYILDNNGSKEDLKRRIDKIMARIEK
ncbi:MAG: AAA family ATPase [Candidatus Aenigmarchaeota archaeon]|nr:AAA family ATPase [Candidatus Aenigmarchaeota archaeon]